MVGGRLRCVRRRAARRPDHVDLRAVKGIPLDAAYQHGSLVDSLFVRLSAMLLAIAA
jgi:hypothetical protein